MTITPTQKAILQALSKNACTLLVLSGRTRRLAGTVRDACAAMVEATPPLVANVRYGGDTLIRLTKAGADARESAAVVVPKHGISPNHHTIMVRLSEGPATYAQLGAAAGIQPGSAGRIVARHMRHLLDVDQSTGGAWVFRLNEAGKKAAAGLEHAAIVERRGRPRLYIDPEEAAKVAHLNPTRAAKQLGCSKQTVRRMREREAQNG
jgi:hypothetical protein